MFNFRKLLEFTSSDLKSYGKSITAIHKKQIVKGIDADGESFTKYSKVYRKQKKDKVFKDQGQISTQINPVNLTLTGKLLKHFRFLSSAVKGEISIKYGFQSDRIAKERGMSDDSRMTALVHGKKTKRVIASSNKLGPDVEEAVGHIFASQVAKNLQKHLKKRTVVYRV